jgi:hypothetical protein
MQMTYNYMISPFSGEANEIKYNCVKPEKQ